MDLTCSTDDNYVHHCAVMLTSFFENNRSETHTIYLLTEGLKNSNQLFLENLCSSHKAKLCCYLVDKDIVQTLPIKKSDHLTLATYYRLFMADLLPNTLDKVLYLDCDIIVNQSLHTLWHTPIANRPLAAVEEMGCSLPDVYDRLGYDKKFGYFNAGVLLINLRYWREQHLTRTFITYAKENYASIKAHDQDVLNGVLHESYLPLPVQWNVEEAFYHYHFLKKNWKMKGFRKSLCNPAILHYTWKPKPWEKDCLHPLRYNYFHYRKKITQLQQVPTVNDSTWEQLTDMLKFRLFLTLGIKGRRLYKLK